MIVNVSAQSEIARGQFEQCLTNAKRNRFEQALKDCQTALKKYKSAARKISAARLLQSSNSSTGKTRKIKRRSRKMDNNKQADVIAILKLYELRRDEQMRRAR